jgi:hypothetical protein
LDAKRALKVGLVILRLKLSVQADDLEDIFDLLNVEQGKEVIAQDKEG